MALPELAQAGEPVNDFSAADHVYCCPPELAPAFPSYGRSDHRGCPSAHQATEPLRQLDGERSVWWEDPAQQNHRKPTPAYFDVVTVSCRSARAFVIWHWHKCTSHGGEACFVTGLVDLFLAVHARLNLWPSTHRVMRLSSESGPLMTPKLCVVDLQIRHGSAGLAALPIALKHLPPKLLVTVGAQASSRLFWQAGRAGSVISERNSSFWTVGRKRNKRSMEHKRIVGFPFSRCALAKKSAQIISRQ